MGLLKDKNERVRIGRPAPKEEQFVTEKYSFCVMERMSELGYEVCDVCVYKCM